jgi:DNA-binding MarR family transcriptional regulator
MATIRSHATPSTQALLYAAYRRTADELLRALTDSGHGQVRHAHGAVFANLDREGTRASVLAERAGMGRAAMGQLVDDLERRGYVERRPDPADGRAKLVIPTRTGLEVIAVVHRVNAAIDRRLRRTLGQDVHDALRTALSAIAPETPVQPRIPPREGSARSGSAPSG